MMYICFNLGKWLDVGKRSTGRKSNSLDCVGELAVKKVRGGHPPKKLLLMKSKRWAPPKIL